MNQHDVPPEEEYYSNAQRPLTPALLIWRLWVFIRDRPRLFQRTDDQPGAKAGQAAESPPLTLGQLAIRLLPAWALLVVILVLAPGLPLRALEGVFQLVRNLTGHTTLVVQPTPTPQWNPQISPIFTPEVDYWADDIATWSLIYQLSPDLIATVMQIESCGDPSVSSSAGASGLFQVMPLHFEPGEEHLDPQTNAQAGLTFFAYLLELSGGNVAGALAGYNAGEWAVDAAYEALPEETQRYIYWGTGIYEDAQNGLQESPRLNEWLEAGGTVLCERAAERLGLVIPETPQADR